MSAYDELRRLHAELGSRLDELEALAACPEPPMQALSAVRLALTRASRARTMLLDRLYPDLIARAGGQARANIEALRAGAQHDRFASTTHISSWTIREITSRWDEYRDASRAMRAAMRERIGREIALVYPLLADADGSDAEVSTIHAR